MASSHNCQWRHADEKVTVGQKLWLSCEGLKVGDRLQELAPQKNHELHVLSPVVSELGLLVTSYKVGTHEGLQVRASVEADAKVLTVPRFEVVSVVPPGEQAQWASSYPFMLAALPLWFYLVLAGAGVGLGLSLYGLVRRTKRRRQFLRELMARPDFNQPVDEFLRLVRAERKASVPGDVISPDWVRGMEGALLRALEVWTRQQLPLGVSPKRIKKILKPHFGSEALLEKWVRSFIELNRLGLEPQGRRDDVIAVAFRLGEILVQAEQEKRQRGRS